MHSESVSVEILQDAIDCLGDPIFVLSSERECIFANKAFLSFFSVESYPDRSLPIAHFWPDIAQANLNCSQLSCDLRLSRGEVFSVKMSLSPISGGSICCTVIAGLSKNETVKSVHAQRLATLGMLAGGVAHDFNNILTGILGHTTYLKTILPPQGAHRESLMAIEEGARKATSVAHQILSFTKLDNSDRSVEINLSDLVTRTCTLLRGAISPQFKIELQVPPVAIPVLGVEGKIAQVLVNLVINARDAIKPGGMIIISLEELPNLERVQKLLSSSDLPCSRYARLKVQDNGHGMSDDVLKQIFEPYFSTKKDKGTGLGLFTVSNIVKQFGGGLEVQSSPNQGTSVSVYLPVMEGEPKVHDGAPGTERELETGSERILIIDDEYAVRNVLSISLQHLGYQVASACCGAEALEKFGAEGARYDLVILDMLMPQLSGEQVFFKLKQLNARTKVLLISGYASEDAVNNVLRNGGLDFIQKPFTIDELARRVRRCLDCQAS